MYRQYEDPYKLEKELNELKELRKTLSLETDEDELISLDFEIEQLKDRINFAWQDEEFEENENY